MSESVLRLLGARPGVAGEIVGVSPAFAPVFGWGVLGLLALLLATALAWAFRPGAALAGPRRWVLLALRVLLSLLLFALLLRPSLVLHVEGAVRQTLALLLDSSASMNLRDPRPAAADATRATALLGRPAPPGAWASRAELGRAALTNRAFDLLPRLARDFDLRAFRFDASLHEVPVAATNDPARFAAELTAAWPADVPRTSVGGGIREALERQRGRPLGGLVLFTDGQDNAGPAPRAAADLAREAGVPLYTVGLGLPAPRDLILAALDAQDVAFARDEVAVRATVRAQGFVGETARVVLSVDGSPVDERPVALSTNAETVVTLRFTPPAAGDFELTVEVEPRPDEILAGNNTRRQRLRVTDQKIRVLFLEQSPRWEFRYLQALLLRDPHVELKCVLFDADAAVARGPDSPYLPGFPARRDELLRYDLVLFGDVDPRNFTPAQLENVADFVSRYGGSLVMVAGRRFSPAAYVDSPLAGLLPVAPAERGPAAEAEDFTTSVPLALTAAGRLSPLLRLVDDDDDANAEKWATLPPVYWVAPVAGAKPGAQVLVTAGGDADGAPVIALQTYGAGQAMFIGTDNTWRWRRNEGDRFHVAFWGRVIQRLALQHLLGGGRRQQVTLDRAEAAPGERIAVTARLFDEAFEPVAEPAAEVTLKPRGTAPDARPVSVTLRAVPGQPGIFQGEFTAPTPGPWHVFAGEGAGGGADLEVTEAAFEAGATGLDEALLRELAATAGGAYLREDEVVRLPDLARARTPRVRSTLDVDLWASPLWFLLIVLAAGAEWALRRWWLLK